MIEAIDLMEEQKEDKKEVVLKADSVFVIAKGANYCSDIC